MKLFILLLTLASFQTNAIEKDKIKHFTASAVISSTLYGYTDNLALSSAACMSVGLAKELTDYTIDAKDLLADALGCSFGIALYEYAPHLTIKPLIDGAMLQFNYEF